MALLGGVDLARAVLKAKDRYDLLSLGSATPIRVADDGFLNLEDEEIRRIYIKMSVKIHPDKLRKFPDATKAFQALVRAYELCCKPDLREEESDDSRDDDESDDDESDDDDDEDEEVVDEAPVVTRGSRGMAPTSYAEADSDEDFEDDDGVAPRGKKKPAAAQKKPAAQKAAAAAAAKKKKKPTAKKKAPRQRRRRSSAAKTRGEAEERRTGVDCPRCRSPWGDHLKGEGQEGLYTEFMRGARQVTCTSCLFEFGCLSAGHSCPDCKAAFEYRPQAFDSCHACSRASCGARFSVARFALSRAAKAGEADRAAEVSRRTKAEASSRARAERAERAREGDADDEAALLELGAFIVSEECPRCGKIFTSGHKKHLAQCKGAQASRGAKKRKGPWLVGNASNKDGDYKSPAAKKPAAATKRKPAAAAKKKPAAAKKKRKPAASDSESDGWSSSLESDFGDEPAPKKKRKPAAPKKAPAEKKAAPKKKAPAKKKKAPAKKKKAPAKRRADTDDDSDDEPLVESDSDSSFGDY